MAQINKEELKERLAKQGYTWTTDDVVNLIDSLMSRTDALSPEQLNVDADVIVDKVLQDENFLQYFNIIKKDTIDNPNSNDVATTKAVADSNRSVVEKYNKIREEIGFAQRFRIVHPGVPGGDILFDTSTFSGWGFPIGHNLPEFDSVALKIASRNASDKITEIGVCIRRRDKNGSIVASGLITIPGGLQTSIQKIEIALAAPVTPTSEMLYLQYYCNRLCTAFGTRPAVQADPVCSYKTNGDVGFDKFVDSTINADFFFALLKKDETISPSPDFVSKISDKIPELKDIKKVNLVTANLIDEKKELVNYEEVVSVAESALQDDSALFYGWGSPIGIRSEFDTIFFKIAALEKITRLRVWVTEDTYTGAQLAYQELNITIEPGDRKDITVFLSEKVSSSKKLFVSYGFDGKIIHFGVVKKENGTIAFPFPEYGKSVYTTRIYAAASNDFTEAYLDANGNGQRNDYIRTGVAKIGGKPSSEMLAMLRAGLQIESATADEVDILLPPNIISYVGSPINMMYQNIFCSRLPIESLDISFMLNPKVLLQWDESVGGTPNAAGVYPVRCLVSYGGEKLAEYTGNVTVSAGRTGSVSVLVIGDSTMQNGKALEYLKNNADNLTVNLLGTRGAGNIKHEAVGGNTSLKVVSAPVETSYRFNITTSSAVTIGDVYINAGSTYRVHEVNLVAGVGYITATREAGNTVPDGSVLVRVSGSGDEQISYADSQSVGANPFWHGGKFDFGKYLSTSNFTMSAGDWVIINIGINDVFGIKTDAVLKEAVSDIVANYDTIINSIKAAVPLARIGIILTIPPAGKQSAFSQDYFNGQTLKRYLRNINLFKKALLLKYSGKESNNIYLHSVGGNIDRKADMKNGVHPNAAGDDKVGLALLQLIKGVL